MSQYFDNDNNIKHNKKIIEFYFIIKIYLEEKLYYPSAELKEFLKLLVDILILKLERGWL